MTSDAPSDAFTWLRRASEPGTNQAASQVLTGSSDHGRVAEAIPTRLLRLQVVRCRLVSAGRWHVKALDLRYKLLTLGIRHCSLCTPFCRRSSSLSFLQPPLHCITAAMSQRFSTADVASHSKADNLWIIVDEDVYDLTKFQDDHPGGKKSTFSTDWQDSP